jgi:hypothetical protein
MSTIATRILHLHVPKTAGTALRTAFQTAKGAQLQIFPHYEERLYANAEADAFDLFSGHYGFETASAIGGRMITVLRDPVDRFVSVYFFWRQLNEKGVERNRKTAMTVKYDLHEFAKIRDEQVLAEEFFNRTTWQMAFGSSIGHRVRWHDQGVTDAQLLERAKANLSGFAAVGFQDDMVAFNARVSRLAGIDLAVRRINVTRDRPAIAEIPSNTRRLIESWVYLDIELLAHARQTWQQAGDDAGLA